jgi:hypothetical protein
LNEKSDKPVSLSLTPPCVQPRNPDKLTSLSDSFKGACLIRHIVLFRFKPEVSEADRQDFLAMLNALPTKISEIVEFQAGFDVVRAARSFDLGLVSSYKNLEDLAVYAKHAHHLPVVERSKEICEQVVSVDFEY